MIPLCYLAAAALRLAFSPVKPEHRLRVFFYRFLVAAFAIASSLPVQALMIMLKANPIFGALVAVLVVIAVGEHLIYADLSRRQMLPPAAPRLPLGF